MSLRSALILGSLLVFLGCSGSEEDPGEGARDAAQGAGETLAFEPQPATALLPNRERVLVVRYTNASNLPQAGVLVDFSLVGTGAGASLSPTKVLTDNAGLASTTLRTGSTAGELMVRARTGDGAVTYATLMVSSAMGTKLSVGVRYDGARAIASYTVTLVPSMTCPQALAAAGETSFQLSASDQTAMFELGYAKNVALVGWGRDETGSKLVRGCKEFTAPVTADPAEARTLLTLELTDLDLTLDAALPVELEINASAATKRFGDACDRAVAAVVTPGAAYSMFADADYLLDAVQNTLTVQGNATAAAALATRRVSDSLAATLQPALVAAEVGPTAYGRATGQLLAKRGASLLLRWTLGASDLTSLSAQSADGSQTLAFANLPPSSIVTRFVAPSAALAVDQLRVNLGLGSYGRTLFAGLDASERAAGSGCDVVFASWWTRSALVDILGEAEVKAVCLASYGQLDSAIDSELAQLDATSAAIQLTGQVPAHARGDYGKVDDLGPGALMGSWGDDALQAALGSPRRTAFQ